MNRRTFLAASADENQAREALATALAELKR